MGTKAYLFLLFTSAALTYPSVCKAQDTANASQQGAERAALLKYEAEHPPLANIPMPAPAENEAFFGAHLTRSATLLETSNKEKHNAIKVVIYGQSIVGSRLFTDDVAAYLKEKFPYADVSLQNLAIGGFGGEQIIRTAVHDLYPTNPDLIIFHVYGGEKWGELEMLFSNIRKYTNADILLMSHALNAQQKVMAEPSAKYMRYIANKYDCELADISYEWPQYVAANNMKPTDLLRDGVHPNRNGNWLLVQLIGRHIRFNPLFPSDWYKYVRTYYATTAMDKGVANPITLVGKDWKINAGTLVSESKNSSIKFSFTGNRVDVTSGHPLQVTKTGSAKILLDGKPIDNSNTAFTITRPSTGVNTWWPAVRQVSNLNPLIEEDWTLTVEDINADSTIYTYKVKGSKTGDDGVGKSNELFVSKSGRVVIQADDIMFTRIKKTFKSPTPKGFEVKWQVLPMFKPSYQDSLGTDKTKSYRTTLVQGIANGAHTLEIIPNGDGPLPIESFEVYEPTLK